MFERVKVEKNIEPFQQTLSIQLPISCPKVVTEKLSSLLNSWDGKLRISKPLNNCNQYFAFSAKEITKGQMSVIRRSLHEYGYVRFDLEYLTLKDADDAFGISLYDNGER